MGMNFSPMYQPVSTKTIKADGDLNINPYDLLATDVKCDTVEATEFVGGVASMSSLNLPLVEDGGLFSTEISGNTVTLYVRSGANVLSGTLNITASDFYNDSAVIPVTCAIRNDLSSMASPNVRSYRVLLNGQNLFGDFINVRHGQTMSKTINLGVGSYAVTFAFIGSDTSYALMNTTITCLNKTWYLPIKAQ